MSKLIEKGGFSSIFYPGYNSKNQELSNQKLEARLQKITFKSKNEIKISRFIKEIKHYDFFFLPIIKNSSLSLAALKEDNFSKCKILNDKDSKFLLTEIPYVENIPFREIFSYYYNNKKHLLLLFLQCYNYLLISIFKLQQISILHNNLNEDSILICKNTENPLLKDFSHSIPMQDINNLNINKFFYIYKPNYYYQWSIEIHIINFLLHKKDILEKENLEKIIDLYIKNNIIFNFFSNEFRENYKKSCINFFQQFENVEKIIVINSLLKFWKTWDQYSLSILYLKNLTYLFSNGFFESKLIIKFSKLLLINISPDPNKRFTLKETKQNFKDIFLLDDSIQNYLNFINNIL